MIMYVSQAKYVEAFQEAFFGLPSSLFIGQLHDVAVCGLVNGLEMTHERVHWDAK